MSLKQLVKDTPATNEEIMRRAGVSCGTFGRVVYGNQRAFRDEIRQACAMFNKDTYIQYYDLLRTCGYSIPFLAIHSGYSRETLYRWLRGDSQIRQSKLQVLKDTVRFLNAKQ